MSPIHTSPPPSPWPRRLAVALVCATFPLIWVGGLVTTYDAGMAVPDWPNTYGYNLFLYPWKAWIFGPWDLFVEHGHRLLGALVGFITLLLAGAIWRWEPRRWVRWMALLAVVLVIVQGVLGGARVLLDERLIAKIHACVGPAFFAFAVALAAVLSPWWRQAQLIKPRAETGLLRRIALLTAVFAYVQLVLGANLRHVSITASPGQFQTAVVFHLIVAAVLVAHIAAFAVNAARHFHEQPRVWRPAVLLAALIVLQLAVGAGTWVVKYNWPAWMGGYRFAAGHVVQAESMTQALVVTAHVAVGVLIFALSVLAALRSFRLTAPVAASVAAVSCLSAEAAA